MGKTSADIFAREGAKLVTDISDAEVQTAAEIGADLVVHRCDLSESQVAALVEAAISKGSNP